MARNCVAFVFGFSVFFCFSVFTPLATFAISDEEALQLTLCQCHRLTLSPSGHLGFIYQKSWGKKCQQHLAATVLRLALFSPFFIFISVANNFSLGSYLIALSHAMSFWLAFELWR